MNQLDASAIPMDIFQETPDLTPYKAVLPRIPADNPLTSKPKNQAWRKVDEEIKPPELRARGHGRLGSFERRDLVRVHGKRISIPRSAQLPAYQAMRLGIANLHNEERASKKDDDEAEFDGAL